MVLIEVSKAGIKMNSKSEYYGSKIPRIIVEGKGEKLERKEYGSELKEETGLEINENEDRIVEMVRKEYKRKVDMRKRRD